MPALQTALEQTEDADRAYYSDAARLQNLVQSKGLKIKLKQAHCLTIAGDADLRERLAYNERGLAHMLPAAESATKKTFINNFNWAIACIRIELDRRVAVAAE